MDFLMATSNAVTLNKQGVATHAVTSRYQLEKITNQSHSVLTTLVILFYFCNKLSDLQSGEVCVQALQDCPCIYEGAIQTWQVPYANMMVQFCNAHIYQ